MGYKTAMDSATTDEAKAELERKYQQKAALLQKQNKAYKDFCEENGLKRKSERITVAKWDREQAAKARAAAKKRIDEVGEAAAASNWHTIAVAGGQTESKYRSIVVPKDIDQNVALTNPGYKSGKPEYTQNCQRCVAAYEMRRRGYDVIAKPAMVGDDGKLSNKDPLYEKWKNIFHGAKYEFQTGFDGGKANIILRMDEWGDGAVAAVRVLWNKYEGHVFIAERINGHVRFVDPQTGNINCENYFTNAELGATMIARIDNLTPSSLIEECIKNRGGKQ